VTALRDESTSLEDFRFFSDRLSTLLIERALNLLPTRPKQVKLGGTGVTYNGQESAVSPAHLVGVSILRSGCALESGLRQVCKDIAIGSLLIQSDKKTGEPALLLVSLPSQLKQGVEGAKETYVMLIDSQIGSGAAGYMAIKVLLDHGVLEERIIFICLLCSRIGGIQAISKAFPRIRIVSGAIDDELEERWSDGIGKQDAQKVFTILPGLGSFGDRYYSPIK
jgi:uridine kinase